MLNLLLVYGLMYSNDIMWYTALYHCTKCGEYTIRGERNSPTHNTKIWFISAEEAEKLIKEKERIKDDIMEKRIRKKML